ncbi:malate dehydrogenase, cytoplasmic-like [Vespa mandarinia]|uniref:malate dehydrogenase, cytoplasmic-like n=1 Tax=Vespa mandarinia TaxID=7446 RepID=UPI00161576B3|nr:malate dehydrogenase, cytoplasmic-like [Vespa mandarinia]
MDFLVDDDENIVFDDTSDDRNVLRIVVTEASTEIAHALMYRILSNNVFENDQLIYLVVYETFEKALFLESIVIELTEFSPAQLYGSQPFEKFLLRNFIFFKRFLLSLIYIGIICTHEPSIAFKDADIVFCIGLARGYEFMDEEYEDLFFEECALIAKFHGETLERYAKRDVKVIVLGNITATIISHYAKSIPKKNFTSLTKLNVKMCAAHIAARTGCRADQIKNIILWGTDNKSTFPDCRYMSFEKDVIINDCLRAWLKVDLPRILRNILNRSWYTRSLAYALAEHCKLLWYGTEQDEWTCMGVYSDGSYGVHEEIFFSYPVFCNNKEYEIVQVSDIFLLSIYFREISILFYL